MNAGEMHSTSDWEELLTLYAFELLEAEEVRNVEKHLGECAACECQIQGLRDTAAGLPYVLPDLNPHPRVRERVLATVQGNKKGALEQPLPGVFVMRQTQQQWRKTPFPGVEVKILYVDQETKNMTTLLKLEAGAKYPAHRHAAVEQCLVLEGSVRIGQIFLQPGDFEYANTGTDHAVIQTDGGCVLMIISNQKDEIFA
jgi:anti-sigma factor ChrR (cupin superfamily)